MSKELAAPAAGELNARVSVGQRRRRKRPKAKRSPSPALVKPAFRQAKVTRHQEPEPRAKPPDDLSAAATVNKSHFFPDLESGIVAFNGMFCYIVVNGAIVRLSDCEVFKPEPFVRHQYNNYFYKTVGKDGKEHWHPIAYEWIERADRRQRDRMTYAPGQKLYCKGALNRWRGWGSKPFEGDITPWNELLDFMFPSAPEERRWFEQWLAWPLQHPGAKLKTAVVLHSQAQGLGKNILFEAVEKIYGPNAIEIGETELYADFNPWQKDRQFVVGNEVQGGRDKRKVIERLKLLITSPEITVNEKYKPQFSIPNVTNFAFTSNNFDPFYLADTDRRFWVWEIPHSKPLPADAYERFHRWKESREGIAALHYHLLHLDLTGFNPDAPAPMTQAKESMIELSYSELERWVKELPDTMRAVVLESGLDDYCYENASQVTLFTVSDLLQLWKATRPYSREGHAAMLRALKKYHKQAYGGKQVRIRGVQARLWIIAKPDEATALLSVTEPSVLAAEYERQRRGRASDPVTAASGHAKSSVTDTSAVE